MVILEHNDSLHGTELTIECTGFFDGTGCTARYQPARNEMDSTGPSCKN